jgi:uncharacterized protein involved in exopolysaccharide biosynthesis
MSASDVPASYPTEFDLASILQVLWEQRLLIALSAALFGIVAVVYSLVATSTYRAEVVVTPVQESALGDTASKMGRLGGLASLVGVDLLGGDMDREAQAVLRSRRLIEEFIKRQVPLDSFVREGKPPTLWRAVEMFKDDVLEIKETQLSGVTAISIEWTEAPVAAQWANEFVALCNDLIRTRALEESARNIKYLNEQLAKTDVVELRRVLYNLVENETKTQMLANARPEYAFTVVDPAVTPEIRWFPRRTIITLLGVSAGIMIGVLAAFARNAWRRRRGIVRAW